MSLERFINASGDMYYIPVRSPRQAVNELKHVNVRWFVDFPSKVAGIPANCPELAEQVFRLGETTYEGGFVTIRVANLTLAAQCVAKYGGTMNWFESTVTVDSDQERAIRLLSRL